MDLNDYGWDSDWQAQFTKLQTSGLQPGRVILQQRDHYRLGCEAGEVDAQLSGRLRHHATSASELPAVGDWIAFRRSSQVRATASEGSRADAGTAQIVSILPRRSKLSRKVAGERSAEQLVATNLDTVMVVMGLDGDFNPRRLERFLGMIWESGAQPVVVLNKSDLDPGVKTRQREIERLSPGVPVLALSALEGQGLHGLNPWLEPMQTVALVGSSGAGKSTLINRLLGARSQRTNTVRESDDRGRHTTTHRQMFRLPGGALLVDNPGIRELQLWVSEQSLDQTFLEIEELATQCRFRDCQHRDEPGCAVVEAVQCGQLDAKRLSNWQNMERERAYQEKRQEQSARHIERQTWRPIMKAYRRMQRDKR